MAAALVLGAGPRLLIRDPGALGWQILLWEPGPSDREASLPAGAIQILMRLPESTEIEVGSDRIRRAVERLGRPTRLAESETIRRARATIPVPADGRERRCLIALAHARLEEALRDPDEVLIALAREEERVERALGRELNAAIEFGRGTDPSVAAYAARWSRFRELFEQHHHELSAELERAAQQLLPNLTQVVGFRVAARLLALAGNRSALARMRSARLQLLGSKRRPSPERGPKYGILYRSERMEDVPSARRGAYARSLAALAVIAARADAHTRRPIGPELQRRRDRRIEALRRGSRA
ncbi:MAG: hypothetical protein ACYCPN_05540 [Thermoplasmata archaeon]